MLRRRDFFSKVMTYGATLGLGSFLKESRNRTSIAPLQDNPGPVMISTWRHGVDANNVGWPILQKGGRALDAVEQGVRVVEADPTGTSVGLGGAPDRDGHVTLDACIMDEKGNAGSVCFVQNYMHPISIARKVMEDTPHVMLAGRGAEKFAADSGFQKTNLLTEQSKKNWERWIDKKKYEPIINRENHDTISSLALDKQGNLSGACTTSGLGYKMHGRVGDSPIIGAGLYVDNEIGACAATGLGELVMKTLGSFLVVELMRQGRSAQEACEEAVARIIRKHKDMIDNVQVCYIALRKDGQTGSYGIHRGFDYALNSIQTTDIINADFYVKP